MALVLKDRVKESSTSSGTGSITLGGAFVGFQTFNAVVPNGSTVYYTIHNTTAGNDQEWEVGVGTFTAPSTLSRDTVLSSSAGGTTKVNFTGSSVLEVFITQPAEQAVYINEATGKVEAFGNGTNSISFTTVVADNITLTAGTISTNASNATDITNKQYVDNLFSTGITYHAPVLVETPTALTATYNQPGGAGNGVGATLTNSGANVALVIDGVTLSNTARVLVYQQANAVQNGIYTVTNPGNSSAQWVLTRATDADTYGVGDPNKLGQGDAFFVTSGNTGAGETYILNTVGAITFGTTNLTFAQISTAQIYNAGTGLNLSNLTFSIANTTVATGLYGDSANVAVIEVNPQGQLTSASNSAINVSNITVGTLANDRTTANASNGANTIVLRDANGSFNANVGSFSTVNATNGNFTNISANASGLTDINASNITSGTISNARTTGSTSNSASTLVLRDADGNFGSNVITASLFSGDGSGINAINASNISSGTIANSRTTAASANGASTIVLRDAGGNFVANTITANISGDISGGTNINASNITSGTINNARTTASSANGASTIVLRDSDGSFSANVVGANSFSGNGTAITAINASNISSGTVNSARISGSYTGITGVGTLTAGTWNANVIANSYTSANSANGANTIVLRDASGDFEVDGITANWFTGNGANLSAINASNVSSGTLVVGRGGTGQTSLTAENVVLGNGANAVKFVAPGSNGNVLTSNGTTWISTAPSGGVTSITGTANQITASASTGAVTLSTPQSIGTTSSVQFGSFGVGTAASGTTGEIRATNNITAFFSDDRLKTKLGGIENALDKVKSLSGFYYQPNETAQALGYEVKKEVGVSAQQVQAIMPEVVAPAPIDDKYLTVRYEKLIPLLIEAIKELEVQVAELKKGE